MATSNSDGITPITLQVNPTANALKVSNGTTGSDLGRDSAVRDNNRIPVILGVSSADGVTPIEIYCDSTGQLLTTTS